MRRNKMMYGLRSSTIILIVMLFISLMATTIVPYTSSAEEEMMYGGTLKVAILEEPNDEIIPLSTSDESDMSIVEIMYDSLAVRDVESGRMMPCIAEEWTTDDMTVTVSLKEGIEFWDGSELTASDVIYSYENYEGGLSTPIEDMSSTDDYSVTFTLSELNPAFFMTEGIRVPIVKEGTTDMGTGPFKNFTKETSTLTVEDEFVREATDRDIEKTEINLVHGFLEDVTIYETVNGSKSEVSDSEYDIDMTTGKVTSFPYTAESTVTADYTYSMTYANVTTNEDYFQGRPYIDGISFKRYSKIAVPKAKNYLGSNILGPAEENAAGAIYDIATDELDMIKSVYPSNYIAFIDSAYMNLLSMNKNEFVYVAYNSNSPPLDDGENGVTKESATQFRKAIDKVYNRTNIVNNILGGRALEGASTVSPADTQWYNPNVVSSTYDLHKADDGLEDANYFDWDADGWKELPDGEDFELDVNYPGSKVDSKLNLIGSTLAGDGGFNDVYVDSQSRIMGFEQIDENESTGNYDVSVNTYKSSMDPGRNMYELFHANGTKNFIDYNYTDFNNAISEANKILDLEERKEAIKDLEEMYMDKIPMSVIYFPARYHVYRNDIYTDWKTGFPYGPDNKQNYLSIHKKTEESLDVSISMQKSINSGDSVGITVIVNDQYGNPVNGATIDLSATNGELDKTTAVTDSNGQARYSFSAPDIDSGLMDVVLTASASMETNMGESFSISTIHSTDEYFSLDVSISESEIESGGSAGIEVSFDRALEEYPSIKLTIIPGSTSSVWLEETNNIGNEGQTFTTTLHTEDVKTDLRVRVKAEASLGEFSDEDDDRIDVAAMEATGTGTTSTSSSSSGEMLFYGGAGALVIVILIIIITMFVMGKNGDKTKETSEDADFFDEGGEEGFFFDEKEEDLGEEEMFEEEEDEAFEEEEVSEEDLFEDEPAEEEVAEEDEVFEEEEPVEEEFEEDIEEEPEELDDEKDTSEEDEVFEG
ncbi:MAG: ABC transporter substrate-binding protein [Thermoplasmatota archaeon]